MPNTTNYNLMRVPVSSRIIGSSTDQKPVTNLTLGTLFLEANTGREWLWDGLAWQEVVPLAASAPAGSRYDLDQRILQELQMIRLGLTILTEHDLEEELKARNALTNS